MQHFTDYTTVCYLEVQALTSREWAMQFLLDDRLAARFSWLLHTVQKISNKFDIFLTATRGEFLTENSQHTGGNGWANCLARNFVQLFPHVCGGLYQRWFSLKVRDTFSHGRDSGPKSAFNGVLTGDMSLLVFHRGPLLAPSPFPHFL